MHKSLFSAHIDESQGLSKPVPIPEITGWTVWKKDQTEIYEVTHNLGLTDPKRQLHVVATPMEHATLLILESVESNKFTISTWVPNGGSKNSAFMFMAFYS